MVIVRSQVGAGLKLIEKSVPGTRGPLPATGAPFWKTCALSIWGCEEHMPPVGLLLGSRSRTVTFHASLVPLFRISRPNCAGWPTAIVAGPVFVNTRLGAAMVIGGVTPFSPGRGEKNVPLMSRPNCQLAVLKNCFPGTFVGVSLSTTVMLMTNCCPAGMMGKPLKVSTPPTLENVCGIGVPLLTHVAVWLT